MPHILRHPLDTRVGRRIAVVAVLSVLLPMGIFGSLVFSRSRAQMQDQERERLHRAAKTAGLEALASLKKNEAWLRWLSPLLAPGSGPAGAHELLGQFAAMTVQRAVNGPVTFVKGNLAPPPVSPDVARHLVDVGVALVPEPGSDRQWMLVRDANGGVIATPLTAEGLFGFGAPSARPAEDRLCIRWAAIACDEAATEAAVGAAALEPHTLTRLQLGSTPYLARTWSLQLQAEFAAAPMTVIMLSPEETAFAPLWRLQRDLILLAGAALALVTLAVLASVRLMLTPLGALEAAAERLTAGDFGVHLAVNTDDEFQTVATGFNRMVEAVRDHIDDIQAFSVGAATALARAIDAKSPWTAGHSERVTAMALRIGRELQLSESEMLTLNRGGLLHDLGKLATPPELLDKPGRLTDDERRVIERHPRDGVRILEPIAHFAPLLPLVLEHHERFDGQGYPDGKAGERIHRLARVLAVADVFDALVSERPYRAGLPQDVAIGIVRDGVGTQFDPEVVAAFLRLMGMPAVARPAPSSAPAVEAA